MALVNICNVVVLNNPAPFKSSFQFQITFECLEDLQEDLEFKIVYVGSAENAEFDQTLDTVMVGPLTSGRHMFVFQADAPDTSKIPDADAAGVTVVLIISVYKGKEFIRVGYYVNNEYTEPELQENPPAVPDFDKLHRHILHEYPRVTRFKIDWDDNLVAPTTSATVPMETGAGDQSASRQVDGAGKVADINTCTPGDQMMQQLNGGSAVKSMNSAMDPTRAAASSLPVATDGHLLQANGN